jgi:hypothetical protein
MSLVEEPELQTLFADKEKIKKAVEELYQTLGLIHDPTATAQRARALILADGVKPEGRLFSHGIMEAREE